MFLQRSEKSTNRELSKGERKMHTLKRVLIVLVAVCLRHVASVPLDASRRRRRRSRSRLLQNIFDHTGNHQSSKGKGYVPMPSSSPAPSSPYWSSSSKRNKGSKSYTYDTIFPAPPHHNMSIKGSHSNSVKGSKCFSYSIGPTASPAPSYSPGHNSSKGKGKGIESGSYVTYPSGKGHWGSSTSKSRKGERRSTSKVKGRGKGFECSSPAPSMISPGTSTPSLGAKTPDPTTTSRPTVSERPTLVPTSVFPTNTNAPTSNSDIPVAPPSAISPVPTIALPTTISPSAQQPIAITPTADIDTPSPVAQPISQTTVPTAGETSPPTPQVTSEPTADAVTLAPAPQPVASVPTLVPSESPQSSPTPPTSEPPVAAPSTEPISEPPQLSPSQTPEPTASTPSTEVTESPTSVRGSTVEATPFSVEYEGVQGSPSDQQCEEAAEVTRAYLQQFFEDFFGTNPFVDLQTLTIEAFGCAASPARIGYRATAIFTDSSDPMALPVTVDLDSLLQVAFELPQATTLLTDLATLPADNPFSSTTSFVYTTSAATQQTTELFDVVTATSRSQQDMAIGFVASVCAVVFIFTSFNVAVQRRNGRRRRVVHTIDGSVVGMPYNADLHESLTGAEDWR